MSFKQRLKNHKLLVSGPTYWFTGFWFLNEALLDHVYITRSFSTEKVLIAVIKNVYFSDHDAEKIRIDWYLFFN